ncbi:MAG TPA: class I SAM-dependent rRNA methyltransferase [bacterium]|nr:class I SAM-dependent rRNA methyltransferase [bacterium]HQL63239.1 class I SAM-dependent rRNA methyltransferase [bacterium]
MAPIIRDPLSPANSHGEVLYPELRVRSNQRHRFRRGHPWIYNNELVELPKEPEPGGLVTVRQHDGEFVGIGMYNRHSIITVRLLTRRIERIDKFFFRQRLRQALDLREQIYPDRNAYRLVHAEADGLPGLVVDRYGEVFVISSNTAGMDCLLPVIVEALTELFPVRAIVLRNDSAARKMESLPTQVEVVWGELPDTVIIEEFGASFEVDVLAGQKTGWFFDQSENRRVFTSFVKDRQVLDTFCYTGAWAIHAARAGAREVIGVDSSPEALKLAARNAERNRVSGVEFIRARVFDFLNDWRKASKEVDIIVLDPPAFSRARKDTAAAFRGYRDLHERALRLIRPGGILFTCSCSYYMGEAALIDSLAQGAMESKRTVRLLEVRGAAPDHPILPATAETRYLTCLVVRVD